MTISTDDKFAIHELSAIYNHAIDYGDADAWINTFTEDGVLSGVAHPYEGRKALTAFVKDYLANASPMHHWTNNHIIQGDGDTASHTCYFQVISVQSPVTIMASGRYNDELKKIDGEWKFFRREATFD